MAHPPLKHSIRLVFRSNRRFSDFSIAFSPEYSPVSPDVLGLHARKKETGDERGRRGVNHTRTISNIISSHQELEHFFSNPQLSESQRVGVSSQRKVQAQSVKFE